MEFVLTVLMCLSISVQAQTIRDGVLFTPVGIAQFVTDHHHLVLTLNVSKIQQSLRYVRDSVFIVNNSVPSGYQFGGLFSYLQGALEEKDKELFNILDTDSQDPMLSTTAEGTPVVIDLAAGFSVPEIDKEINKLLRQIDTHDDTGTKIFTQQVSSLDITQNQIAKLTQLQHNVEFTTMPLHVEGFDDRIGEKSNNFVFSSLSSLEFLTSTTLDEVEKIILMIQNVMATGEFATNLLNPGQLEEALSFIQDHQIKLPYPSTGELLLKYYEISECFVKPVGDLLHFVVRIPLRTNPDFNLYKAIPFWVPYNNTIYARKVANIPRYIAVREDGQSAVEVNDLRICTLSEVIFCPSDYYFFQCSLQSCLFSLFRGGDQPSANCESSYRRDLVAEFHSIQDQWIGSIQKDLVAEKVCEDDPQPKRIILSAGINAIPICSNCQVISDSFTLPKVSHKKSTEHSVTLLHPPYFLPPYAHLPYYGPPDSEPNKIPLSFTGTQLELLQIRANDNPQGIFLASLVSSYSVTRGLIGLVVTIIMIKFAQHINGPLAQANVNPH